MRKNNINKRVKEKNNMKFTKNYRVLSYKDLCSELPKCFHSRALEKCHTPSELGYTSRIDDSVSSALGVP